jgi:glycerol-3-phosphate dehydrogenase (NAD(P)+)
VGTDGNRNCSMRKSVAVHLQQIFMAPALRVYTHHDMVGVEMGGALKNIVAIAVGISDGLGFGDNTRATLITRGLAEMARLGYAMGGELLTFAGLSGLGDLVCTCTSPHSRNHSTGIRIGRGEKLQDILAGTDMVIEGVKAAQVGQALSAHYGVDLPITQETYRVLYEDKPPRDAVRSLMGREGKYEIEESRTERKSRWELL